MAQKDPSKTEKATDKRRKKARSDGSVPKGQELGKAMVLVAGLIALHVWIRAMGSEIEVLFAWFLKSAPVTPLDPQRVQELLLSTAVRMAYIVLPVILFVGFVAYLTQRLQVGPLWSPKVFQPKLKVFNLMNGLKKFMPNPKMFMNIGKSVLQAIAIGFAPYMVLREEIDKVAPLFFATPDGVCAYLLTTGSKMTVYALVPMLIIAIADTWYVRWDYEEQLKMSKDEVKDERKQMEGDPKIKSEQRRKMLKSMAARMMADVPRADVVVTNPTHIAVALQYDPLFAPAPRVLAKGVDALAERIKDVAREHGIPIRENKPLARALYKSVEIGETIPEELFQATASLLAQLDKFKRRRP